MRDVWPALTALLLGSCWSCGGGWRTGGVARDRLTLRRLLAAVG